MALSKDSKMGLEDSIQAFWDAQDAGDTSAAADAFVDMQRLCGSYGGEGEEKEEPMKKGKGMPMAALLIARKK